MLAPVLESASLSFSILEEYNGIRLQLSASGTTGDGQRDVATAATTAAGMVVNANIVAAYSRKRNGVSILSPNSRDWPTDRPAVRQECALVGHLTSN